MPWGLTLTRARGNDGVSNQPLLMTTTDHRAAIALCESLDQLQEYVQSQPKALDVVFDVCEHWVYEALVIRMEGEC